MKINQIEKSIKAKMEKVETECSEDLRIWVVEKMKEYHEKTKRNVRMSVGMGTFFFTIQGVDCFGDSFEEFDSGDILQEITDTLKTMAGTYNLYLSVDSIKIDD